MNKILLFFVSLAFVSCGSGDEEPTNPPGAPGWTDDFPVVAQGAISLDLNLKTDKASRVYWLVSTKSLDLDASAIKSQAVKALDTSIKFHGVIELTANEEKRETIEKLTEHTRYFVSIVAENKTDSVLQTLVIKRDLTTYYRQDTSEFVSTAESRTALYLIYRPEEMLKYHDHDEKYPILFFLAGNGELPVTGKPINMFNGNGTLPEYIKKGNNVPMIVMSVQHVNKDWSSAFIDETVNHGLKTYPVNTKKVYLTGTSGGGFGCWRYAIDHADKLTAIVPISGGGNTGKACTLKNLPIWAFHNQTDNTVASSNSTNMINAVKDCPPAKGVEVKLTYFPDTGHNCWRRVYDQNHKEWSKSPAVAKFDIYAWLLTKSK